MTPGDPYALWDAAYVLGSLASDERREYEAHLHRCMACRSAVTDLSGMPALLALLDRDSVADEPPAPEMPPEMLGAVLAKVAQRRRRSRWAVSMVSAAAVLLAIALVVAVWPSSPAPASNAASVELVAVEPSEFTATMTLTDHDWGTHIAMACTYTHTPGEPEEEDDGDRLAMVTVGRDGRETRLATWTAVTGATALPQASTSLSRNEIAAVQVVSADSGEVLLEKTFD
jgi:hypothetical protein